MEQHHDTSQAADVDGQQQQMPLPVIGPLPSIASSALPINQAQNSSTSVTTGPNSSLEEDDHSPRTELTKNSRSRPVTSIPVMDTDVEEIYPRSSTPKVKTNSPSMDELFATYLNKHPEILEAFLQKKLEAQMQPVTHVTPKVTSVNQIRSSQPPPESPSTSSEPLLNPAKGANLLSDHLRKAVGYFRGTNKDTVSVDVWLGTIDMFVEEESLSPKQHYSLIWRNLRDDALEWYNRQRSIMERTPQALSAALRSSFTAQDDTPAIRRDKLRYLQQAIGENVSTYTATFRKLSASASASQLELKEMYIAGLKHSLKRQLSIIPEGDLEHLYTIAGRLEYAETTHNDRRSQHAPPTIQRPHRPVQHVQTQRPPQMSFQQQYAGGTPNNSHYQHGRGRGRVFPGKNICRGCGQQGHWEGRCPNRQSPNKATPHPTNHTTASVTPFTDISQKGNSVNNVTLTTVSHIEQNVTTIRYSDLRIYAIINGLQYRGTVDTGTGTTLVKE